MKNFSRGGHKGQIRHLADALPLDIEKIGIQERRQPLQGELIGFGR